ncbi:MAG: sulfatase [Verrucomicrobiae bacterium]|nr:sulfatase [Verrucomicrobiae bacterium]NNJ87402.1 sulfatase [Akkermansiaceae bacterium]
MRSLLLLTFLLIFQLPAVAAERPNILWITSEDNDYGWLGCYGNKEAKTPRLDKLAASGLLFKHAYSNAPVCAVARSTILNGAYAPTMGTQHMRSRHTIPRKYKPYVSYLKALGYYCSNRSKTDYNFAGNDKAIWDACSKKAHYKNRPNGAPFFSIFNLTVSHESSLFDRKKKKGKTRLDPSKVTLRPYLPDLPAIRSDVAHYHDIITSLDTQIGKILDDLVAAGLADDTIVFYYADHGGITPRGKRYLKDTGVHIPMLVHVPKKWQHLSPFKPGSKIDETVAFVDLAPTLLSLVGLEKPSQMQGRAFLGSKREEPGKDEVEFLYADRFDEIYGMRRGITDGRWKYIRRFTPHLPAAPYSSYQFGQKGWKAWRDAWKAGKLTSRHQSIWESNQPVEELFDTASDPWEVDNLAADPAHAKRLKTMRARLKKTMVEVHDTAIIPEPMFSDLIGDKTIAHYTASRKKDMPALVDLAFKASARNPKNLPELISRLKSPDPIQRYWATLGCVILGKAASSAESALSQLLDDSYSAIRVEAASALMFTDKKQAGTSALLKELARNNNEYAQLNLINTFKQLKLTSKIPDTWVNEALKKEKGYIKRLAQQVREERSKK